MSLQAKEECKQFYCQKESTFLKGKILKRLLLQPNTMHVEL